MTTATAPTITTFREWAASSPDDPWSWPEQPEDMPFTEWSGCDTIDEWLAAVERLRGPNPLAPPTGTTEADYAPSAPIFDAAEARLRSGGQTHDEALRSMAEQLHRAGVPLTIAEFAGAWLAVTPASHSYEIRGADLGPYFDVDPEEDGFLQDDIEAARAAWWQDNCEAFAREHPVEGTPEPEHGACVVREAYARLDDDAPEPTDAATSEQADKLFYTDVGNARRLVAEHGADLRFVPGIGWHTWDGTRWRRDDDGEVVRRFKAITDSLLDDARRLAPFGSDKADKLWKWGLASQSKARVEAAIVLASTEAAVIAHVADLDADEQLLNAANGTLDLRTGQLREHRRADLITRQVGLTYSTSASCPRWQRFIDEVTDGDKNLAGHLQRAIGYSLSGDTREQVMFVVHGDGSNGKTTLLETVAYILGDYARSADPASFTTAASGRSVRSDLARLRGARLVRAAEVERDVAFAESLIKQMTGGEPITAAFKFKDEFEYRPSFKVWLGANDLPAVLGDDHAIWRRLRVIPFNVRIDSPDKRLAEKLKSEAPGILAWAVQGALDWHRDGLGECAAVTNASRAYGRQQDRIGAFLDECCQLDPNERVENGELLAAYKLWEQANGRQPLADFYKRLDRRGLRTVRSHGKRYRAGLALLAAEEAA